jgi:hypothetical protein
LDEDNEEEFEDQQILSIVTNKEATLETLHKYIEGNEGMEDLFKLLGRYYRI